MGGGGGGGGGGVLLPCISHIGMYRSKGYGFCAISIRKKDSYKNSKLISRKLFVGVLI